jgi:hypothetical protein
MGSLKQALREGMSTQAVQITSLTPSTLVKTDPDNYLASDPTNYMIGVGTHTLTVGTVAPTDPPPETGDIWIDSSP